MTGDFAQLNSFDGQLHQQVGQVLFGTLPSLDPVSTALVTTARIVEELTRRGNH